jgi:hypothetical protein
MQICLQYVQHVLPGSTNGLRIQEEKRVAEKNQNSDKVQTALCIYKPCPINVNML